MLRVRVSEQTPVCEPSWLEGLVEEAAFMKLGVTEQKGFRNAEYGKEYWL